MHHKTSVLTEVAAQANWKSYKTPHDDITCHMRSIGPEFNSIQFSYKTASIFHCVCSSSLDLSTADYVPEFPAIKTQMGPKHRAFPLLSSLWSSIRSTHTIVGTRQCFFNGNSAFRWGQSCQFFSIPKNLGVSSGWWGTPPFGWTLPNCAMWLIDSCVVVNYCKYLLFILV